MKIKTKLKQNILLGLSISLAGILIPVVAFAATDTKTTVINANISSTISLTTSGTVAINVIPTGVGAMSSASDTVSVSTNTSNGYALTFSDADTATTLVSGSNTILADSGTQGSPSASLTLNRWGYRVDGVGGFGASSTTAESNVASSTFKWAGVPSSASPNTLKTTSTTATADTTTVWFGVKVDTSKPSGSTTTSDPYTDTVTYTATTNS